MVRQNLEGVMISIRCKQEILIISVYRRKTSEEATDVGIRATAKARNQPDQIDAYSQPLLPPVEVWLIGWTAYPAVRVAEYFTRLTVCLLACAAPPRKSADASQRNDTELPPSGRVSRRERCLPVAEVQPTMSGNRKGWRSLRGCSDPGGENRQEEGRRQSRG